MSGTGGKDGWAGVPNGRPEAGRVAERTRTTPMRDLVAFTGITGERDPIHSDRALAESGIFAKRVVRGGNTAGNPNAIVAEDLPVPGAVFLAVAWKVVKAVGVGETTLRRVDVLAVRPNEPIRKIAPRLRDGAGGACLVGTATADAALLPGR